MKKFVIVVIALLYSFIGVNMVFAADATWTQKANFGGKWRFSAVGFSIGNKGYMGTGFSCNECPYITSINTLPSLKDFWEYDPTTDTWTQKADFGGGVRSDAVSFSIGNKGYVGTGTDRQWYSGLKDFWEYDPAANRWMQKADFGGKIRSQAVGFSIGNKGYIGTGSSNENYCELCGNVAKDFWEYDPATDTWTEKADFAGALRYKATGFSIGNKGYVGTGLNKDSLPQKDFWEYDPATDIWTKKADFGGTARGMATGFSIASKGYVGTGLNIDALPQKDFWEYDPATDIWTKKADFGGTARFWATGFSIGSKGYIGTGWTIEGGVSYATEDFWEYDTNGGNNIFLVPTANTSSLWPPNNKLVPVTIWANVSSGGPVTLTAQVSCNEPAKRDSDWTEPVINQATGVISLSLRATRAGSGTGRVYSITITATDANGNSATETIDIVVPHDQAKK